MTLKSVQVTTAVLTLAILSYGVPANAQHATFADLRDAVPGRYFSPGNSSPSALDPNTLQIGLDTGLFNSFTACRPFQSVLTPQPCGDVSDAMDTISFVVQAPLGYYVSSIAINESGRGVIVRSTADARGGAAAVVAGEPIALGEFGGPAQFGLGGGTWSVSRTQEFTDPDTTSVPVSLTTGLFAYAGASGLARIELDAASVTVTLGLRPNNTPPEKKTATIEVAGFAGTYDGQPHRATGTATGPDGEDLSGLLDLGESFTDVPGGTATWTFHGGEVYNDASGTASIIINPADATIVVNGFSGIYDGQPHGATGTATGISGTTGDLNEFLDLGASFTDVPGGIATWTFGGNPNYNVASGTAVIEIDPADATIVVDGFSGIYDGQPHGATGTATGINGTSLDGLDLGASFTDVPGGIATWTFGGNPNYNTASGSAAIEIAPATATIVVNGFSGTYDGQQHGATGTATGINGTAVNGLDLGASFTNVPGGEALWTFSNSNYHAASGSAAIVITQATPNLTWPTPAAITAGTALSGTQLNATARQPFPPQGTVPGTFAYDPAAGTTLAAGTHTLSVTFTPTDSVNYTDASKTVQITVNAAPAPPAGGLQFVNPGPQSDRVGEDVRIQLKVTGSRVGDNDRPRGEYTAIGLPQGLRVEDDGEIRGEPKTAGVYQVTVHLVQKKTGATATTSFTWTVLPKRDRR